MPLLLPPTNSDRLLAFAVAPAYVVGLANLLLRCYYMLPFVEVNDHPAVAGVDSQVADSDIVEQEDAWVIMQVLILAADGMDIASQNNLLDIVDNMVDDDVDSDVDMACEHSAWVAFRSSHDVSDDA